MQIKDNVLEFFERLQLQVTLHTQDDNPHDQPWRWLATPLLLAFLLMSWTMPVHGAQAVVFAGAGTCDGCADTVAKLLTAQHYQVRLVDEHQLNDVVLQGASLYVQPGGSDDIMDTLSVLTPHQINSIRQFVAGGGAYLGICAGGYLAGQYADQAAGVRAFGLVELSEIEQELPATNQAQTIDIMLPDEHNVRQVYYQAGPHFGAAVPASGQVMAYYAKSGHVAARLSRYGLGRVGLVGPHYEADASWYADDGMPVTASQQQLLWQMLDALLAPAVLTPASAK